MSQESIDQHEADGAGATPLTNVWVNVSGSGEQVLKEASGSFDENYGVIKTDGGTVSNSGPIKDKTYVIGADGFPTKYDWQCYASDPEGKKFAFKQ